MLTITPVQSLGDNDFATYFTASVAGDAVSSIGQDQLGQKWNWIVLGVSLVLIWPWLMGKKYNVERGRKAGLLIHD